MKSVLYCVFTTFQSLAENHRVKHNAVLNEIVMLGWGSVISRFCKVQHSCSSDLVTVCII